MRLENVLAAVGVGGVVAYLWHRWSGQGGLELAATGPKPLTPEERDRRYGPLLGRVTADPSPDNPERLKMPAGWAEDNLVTLDVPELANVKGANRGRITLHRKIADPFQRLVKAWKDAGVLEDVVSWEGTYNPRFVRGSTTGISTHAYAASFDLNATGNGLNETPLPLGKRGSVLRLVPIAERLGWAWGGRFKRIDGMHFEYVEPV